MKKAQRLTILAFAGVAMTGMATAAEIKVPPTVVLPQLEPLVPACSDPAADSFLELDLFQRPPAGATRVQRIGAWVTSDGVFHWPFVMRARNLGDKPFIGKQGQQSVTVTEEDKLAGTKRVVGSTPFAQIPAHSGVAVRFEFVAPAAQVEKGKFRRTYTLQIAYQELGGAIVSGSNGDCNLRNNNFAIEIDGSTKSWISAKK